MNVRVFALCAALGCAATLAFAPPGRADEAKDPKPADKPDQPDSQPADPPRDQPADRPSDPAHKPTDQQPADRPSDEQSKETKEAEANVIRFENDVRLNVQHDVSTGSLTFRSSDPAVRLTQPPVVMVGTREYPLVAAEPGVWRISNEAFRAATFPSNTTVRIVSEGKTYTTPLMIRAAATRVPPTVTTARFGGQIVRLTECNAEVEVVRDPATGMLTLHPVGNLKIVEAPSVMVTTTEEKSPATVTFTKVDGQGNVWRVTHPTFRTTTTTTTTTTAMPTARIRVLVDGRTCEAPLVWTSRRGGQMVQVSGGPRFEVVPDPTNRTYTFYAVDETLDGRPYVVENPQVVVRSGEGTRTYTLAPVPGEQRAWRMVGLDAGVREPLDGMLRFTLGGRSLETSVGLSGLHVGVR